jgi:hypothetical protein
MQLDRTGPQRPVQPNKKNGTANRCAVNNGPTNRSKKRNSLGFRLLGGLDGLLLSRGFRRGFFGLLLGVL